MKPLKRGEINERLKLKTTQSDLLKIEQLRILSDTLNTNQEALDAFLVLMKERHDRAAINSRQALTINHQDGKIFKLKKTILDIENSEIFKLGKLIWDTIHQKKDKEQKAELLQHELVHKDEYNKTVTDLKETIKELHQRMKQQTSEASTKIHDFEERTDSLLEQLKLIQGYMIKKHGSNSWLEITAHLQKEIDKGA